MTYRIFLPFIGFLLIYFTACQTPSNPDELIAEHGAMTGLPAIDAITQDIKAKPNDPSLYMARCEAYSNEQMYKEAVKDAEHILRLDSTDWKSYRILAWCYLDNSESKKAVKTLEKGLELQPKNIKLLLVHSEILHILKQYDESLVSAENVLKQSPLNTEGWFMKGLVLKEMGDTVNAINCFQTAVEQDAEHFEAYLELGYLFYKLGDKRAVAYYQNALRIDSTNYLALSGLAQFYHQNILLEDAKKAYERLIYHHPQEVDGSYNYGLLFMELKDYEKAYHFFNVAVQYDPQFGEAYYYKGMALEKMGKLDEAIREYTNAKNNNDRFNLAAEALERLQK